MRTTTLIISMLLICTIAAAQDIQDNPKSPKAKIELGGLYGRAINMDNFKLVGYSTTKVVYGNLRAYVNFNRIQVGIGFETNWIKYNAIANNIAYGSKYNRQDNIPHIVINRLLETGLFSFYGGVMAGYIYYDYKFTTMNFQSNRGESWEYRHSGVVGGLQGGVLININRYVAINTEIAARASERKTVSKHTYTGPIYGQPNIGKQVYGGESSHSLFYIPIMIGLRIRI